MSLIRYGILIYAAWKGWGLRVALAIAALVAALEMSGITFRLLDRKARAGKPASLNTAQSALMPIGLVWGTFVMFLLYSAIYCLAAWLLSKPISF